MKTQFLKIAGVKSEKEFYQKYPTEESFFAAHPEAKMMRNGGTLPKAQSAGESFPMYSAVGPVGVISAEGNKYPYYNQLTSEEKRFFNDEGSIGRGVRSIAKTGKRGQTYNDLSRVAKDIESFGAEMTGIPGTIRFSKSPLEKLAGAGRTIEATILGSSPFITSPYNQEDVADFFDTMDAFGVVTTAAAPLKTPLQQGVKQVFKSTTTPLKIVSKLDDAVSPVVGTPNFSNTARNAYNRLYNAAQGTDEVLNEVIGELLRGKVNRKSIEKGNKWLSDWINHPTTQAKIDNSIDTRLKYLGFYSNPAEQEYLGFYSNPAEQEKLLELIRTQAKNFKPNTKEYSLLKQLDDNLQQYLSKTSKKPIHMDNWGVSYEHQYSPLEKLNIEKGLQKPEDRFGSWISRTLGMPQKKRISTTVHEGTHDWVTDDILRETELRNIALKNMTPKALDDYIEWASLRNNGEDPVKIMGKKRAMQGYLADPTEQHARIMELRQQLGMTPDDVMDIEGAEKVIKFVDSGKSVVTPLFLNVMGRDPAKLAELFNKFWMAPPITVGAVSLGNQGLQGQQSQVPQQKDGGNVPTNPALWSRAKAAAKQKYDVYPSAYANGFASKWYKERGGGWRKAEMGGCMECGGQMAEGGPIAEYVVNPMEMFYQDGGQNDQMYQTSQEEPDLSAAINEISRMIAEGDDPNEIYSMLIENGVEEDYALDILEEAMEALEETEMEDEDVPMSNEEMLEFERQEEQLMQQQLTEDDDELYSLDPAEKMRKGGSISIDPAKKGTFKAQATRMGMSVQEAAEYILRHKEKYSPAMVKKANFAKNFAKELGGEIFDLEQYKDGGSIPQRYRTMGFTRVGAKRKSTRPGKKWMVLAKKGDQYKVVHGGWKGMQDFTQHRNSNRKKRFWDRMGGRDSAKAKDSFSPLYWHKRFGTWAEGGEPQNAGFQALPESVQNKILRNMEGGGGAMTMTYENTLANMTPNTFNKTLVGANTLADPRNMIWALPNRGFLGTLKGIAGAAAGLSGAALGYSKLFGVNNNPYSVTLNTPKYQGGGQAKPKTFQEWMSEDPVFRRYAGYTTYMNNFISSLNIGVPAGETSTASPAASVAPVSNQQAPASQSSNSGINTSQSAPVDMFQQLQRKPSIVANPRANDPVSVVTKEPMRQITQIPTLANDPKIKTELSPQTPQNRQVTYGDPFGQVVANNALAGLGMLNDVLFEERYAREYEEMLRRTGNTDNRYNASNPVNPFGNYTLNAGPASNFGLLANTPIQDFGTSMAGARYGGATHFNEGGEYIVTDEELQAILAAGGEIEYLD